MVTTVCYKNEKVWETRELAEQYFLECMMKCDAGSERDRYVNIYCKLKSGRDYCTDNIDEI